MFTGCGEKQAEPLRVCVDVDGIRSTEETCENLMNEFFDTLALMGGPDDIELELIPEAGAERKNALPLTFYREADTVGRKPDAETTWEDMLSDETGVLTAAATWFPVQEGEFHFYGVGDNYLAYTFGAVADYDTETLLFTEEELLQRTTEVLALRDAYDSGAYANAPAHYQSPIHIGIDYPDTQITDRIYIEKGDTYYLSRRGIDYAEAKTMVPIYADDGGTTASVTSFAAINANTKRAEDAFFVLDVLLDLSHQRNFDLYEFYLAGDMRGIPVH